MGYFDNRNKIQKNYKDNENQKNELDNKKSNVQISNNKDIFKYSKVLFDSGWTPLTTIVLESGVTESYKNGEAPVGINLVFIEDINIPQEFLNYVDISISVKSKPDLTFVGTNRYIEYDYDDPYYLIEGDSELIFKGTTPFQQLFHSNLVTNGNILESHTSKWFQGTLEYTDSGHSYRIESAYVKSIKTYYNVSTKPGAPGADWTSLDSSCIDNLFASSLTGQGTKVFSEMIFSGSWSRVTTTTKRFQGTVPLFEDITIMTVEGFIYIDDVYDSYGDITAKFPGSLNSESSVPSGDKGTAVLVSFDLPWSNYYKLWYSTKRTRQFWMLSGGYYTLSNLPTTTDYPVGETLPYTQIRIQINPEGYPTESIDDIEYNYSRYNYVWSKVTDEKFKFHLNGLLVSTKKITNAVENPERWANETYSSNGTTYDFDGENREDKITYFYFPENTDEEVRLCLSLNMPKLVSEIPNYRKI
jgi:hypothetical protein